MRSLIFSSRGQAIESTGAVKNFLGNNFHPLGAEHFEYFNDQPLI